MNLELLNRIRAAVAGENALETAYEVSKYHRIQASTGFREAAQLCARKLNALGIRAEVLYEPADGVQRHRTIRNFQEWDIRSGVCRIVSPEVMEIADFSRAALSIMPRSVGCDFTDRPIEVVFMDRGTSPEAYDDLDLAGKLLFVHENFNEYLKWAVDGRGAAGFITDFVMEPENHHDVLRYTSFWWEETPDERKAFGFTISPDQGKALEVLCLRAREKGQPVLASGAIDARLYPGRLDYVDAFLPGETDEEIWITAHLCHPRTSANDNASGVGASIEAMRVLHELTQSGGLKLRRGVRLLLVPEMTGTLAYLNRIGADSRRVLAGINLDMVGAKQVDGYGPLVLTQTPHTTPSIANAAAKLVLDLAKQEAGYLLRGTKMPLFNSAISSFTGGSDHYILSDPTVGIPTLMLGQWPDKYYHTSGDTTEVLSAHTLSISASLAAMYAALMSQMDEQDVPLLTGAMQELMAADIRRLDEDALCGQLPQEQLSTAYALLKQYYEGCVADVARFVPETEALAETVELEQRFTGMVCDMAAARLGQRMGGLRRPMPYAGPVPERTYRMPVDSWTGVLDTPERQEAMQAWKQGPEKQLRDAHNVEILTQYYIDGQRPLEEVVECVSIDCREPDRDAIRAYIRLLETTGLVRMRDEQ